MVQFKDALHALISPEMVAKASTVLGEKESNIKSAISAMIPSFLGVMLKNGNTPQIGNILHEAGNLNLLLDLDNVCEEKPTEDQQRIGDDFLQHLLGDQAVKFTNPIADQSGISKVATNRLISMISPIVAGFLGNKLVKENRSLNNLLSMINDQKNSFKDLIPKDIIQSFGLSSVLSGNANPNKLEAKQEKNNMGWLKWLILILLLVLLFFWWRSCQQARPVATVYEDEVVVQAPGETPATATAPEQTGRNSAAELTLPNGEKIQAYRGGIEDEMIKYLNSDAYKNATENDLKNKWFEFDNIKFKFDSSTELMDNSQAQINNIAAILKNYKNAKVRIAGFADKRGSEEVNMEISKERAKTIETLLERAGVGSQVVRTEGYGDEYAEHSASAPDSERAKDRDIALRFVK